MGEMQAPNLKEDFGRWWPDAQAVPGINR